MRVPIRQFGHTTGHQSQQWHKSPLNPNPNQQLSRHTPVQDLQRSKINIHLTLASPGHDERQNIEITQAIDKLQEAMTGVGCDNSTFISVLTDSKFQDPQTLHQFTYDYDSQTTLNLAEQIEQKTQGFFRVALMALLKGPLDHDVYTLEKALSGEDADKRALNDVLLCRSNANIRGIVRKYNSTPGRDLVQLIRSKVDEDLFRLYNVILSGARGEDAVLDMTEIDVKVAEIQRLIEGSPTTDLTPIIDILASANDAGLRAMSSAYENKYQRKLDHGIARKFCGSSMEDALLQILDYATDRGKSDADGLWNVLRPSTKDDSIFIYRALRLYWGGTERLQEVHAAYKKTYGMRLLDNLNGSLSGDYRELMIALIGEKSTSTYMYR
ncbi:annexin domain-containing protein [Trichoderma breve]|uniref:Annexin domain-containing protein n=1 Tax=Trichoderma breve TaxID=2034170 RepID=A0A9W9BB15_9HYPO|nr:annexin domain-containing protein [Trichoderma breve]KAJ4856663.1 annexin domain-containing protein [Trichoderma breve]